MIACKLVSEEELKSALDALGYEETDISTETGTFWRDNKTDIHVLIPESWDGFYPDWMLDDIREHISELTLRSMPAD